MEQILFIDACVRKESRTRELTEYLLTKLSGEVYIQKCSDILPVSEEAYLLRREFAAKKQTHAEEIRLAQQFAKADIIVIAAPYWDLSFPAILKAYLEQVNVAGVTFEYTPEGIPKGLCNCRKLFYVTTAGGPIISEEYGFGYVRELARTFYEIPEVLQIKAEGLDIIGADVAAIMSLAKKQIDEMM